eukprot:g20656.t1
MGGPGSGKKGRPVRCIETGHVYPSLVEAARAVGRQPASFYMSLRTQTQKCAGYRWEYVTPIFATVIEDVE